MHETASYKVKAAEHILDGKLPLGSEALFHGGYAILWLGDQIAKFKIRQIKNTVFWQKSPNLMPTKFSHYMVVFWSHI